MKIIKIIVCVILLISGIAIMLYPSYNKKKTKNKQDEMITQLEEQIKDNKGKNKKQDREYDAKLIMQEVNKLEIEEREDEKNIGVREELLKKQEVIGMINIPVISTKYAIVEGSDRANIAVAIGHLRGSAWLGGKGNCVLAGHNGGIYGEFFKNINKLKTNDSVILIDEYGDEYIYIVYEMFKVKPTDTYVTENMKGYILTLITCTDKGKNRLIVRCKLKKN